MQTKELASPLDLIKSSLQIYFKKENLLYLTKIALLYFLVNIPAGVILVSLGITSLSLEKLANGSLENYLTLFSSSVPSILLLIATAVFVLVIILSLWYQVISIKAVAMVVKGERLAIRQILKLAWGRVWKFSVTSLFMGLMVLVGLVLLVIPGIVFAVWFSFAIYIVVTENVGAIDALRKSKALVSG